MLDPSFRAGHGALARGRPDHPLRIHLERQRLQGSSPLLFPSSVCPLFGPPLPLPLPHDDVVPMTCDDPSTSRAGLRPLALALLPHLLLSRAGVDDDGGAVEGAGAHVAHRGALSSRARADDAAAPRGPFFFILRRFAPLADPPPSLALSFFLFFLPAPSQNGTRTAALGPLASPQHRLQGEGLHRPGAQPQLQRGRKRGQHGFR